MSWNTIRSYKSGYSLFIHRINSATIRRYLGKLATVFFSVSNNSAACSGRVRIAAAVVPAVAAAEPAVASPFCAAFLSSLRRRFNTWLGIGLFPAGILLV